jgi:3'-phosphoadenosine 5'-phosphosulfate sulfotransferase (PAPS reductase)/FAD synthetase
LKPGQQLHSQQIERLSTTPLYDKSVTQAGCALCFRVVPSSFFFQEIKNKIDNGNQQHFFSM